MIPDYTTMMIVGFCGALLFLVLWSLRLPDWRGRWKWIWKKKAPATPATPAATRRPAPMPRRPAPPPTSYPAPTSYPPPMIRRPVHHAPEVRL